MRASGHPRRTSLSDLEIEPVYTPDHLKGWVPNRISASRAHSPTPAASIRPCTAAASGPCGNSPGFGSADDTNRRFHYLLHHGQTGLSVAFDLPTLMGTSTRMIHGPFGEVGRCGVAISSLADMERLFRRHSAGSGHNLDDDQWAAAVLRHVPRGRPQTRHALFAALAAPSRTTFERVHRTKRVAVPT